MPQRPFLDLLAERVVLFDGGTGTAIYSRGVFLNRCYEELNFERPALVDEVHRSFIVAGADVIETNSFAANQPRLEPHGLGDKVRETNRLAAQIARRAAGDRTYVAGSLGPLGIRLEPWGPTTFDEAVELYRVQIEGLLEGGIDLAVCETFADLALLEAAIRAIRQTAPDLPIVALMTVDEEGRSPEGVPADRLGRKLDAFGTDVIGVNCSVGPAPMLAVVESFEGVTTKPLAAMPNAGLPRTVEGRTLYLSTPAYMASYARRFVAAGARVIGGCCGVNPEHVRALRAVIDGLKLETTIARTSRPLPVAMPTANVPREQHTRLARALHGEKFVTVVEWPAPTGWEAPDLPQRMAALVTHQVDALLIPDEARGSARMNPLAWAEQVRRAIERSGLNLELILHYACRDRTLHEMQADMLGAQALGLQHLFVVTGTTPRPGEGVWSAPDIDVDAVGLTNLINRLNHGLDVGDNPIGASASLMPIVQVLPADADRDAEVRRFEWKVDAGAEAAITSPLFETATLRDFLTQIESVRVPLLAALWPLSSLREAEYLAGEVPGVAVPPEVLGRMAAAQATERELEAGTAIFVELTTAVAPLVEGFVLRGPRAADPQILAALAQLKQQHRARRLFGGQAGMKSRRQES